MNENSRKLPKAESATSTVCVWGGGHNLPLPSPTPLRFQLVNLLSFAGSSHRSDFCLSLTQDSNLSQVSESVFIEKSDLRLTWNHNYAGEVLALGNMTINRIADLKRVAGIRYIFTYNIHFLE